MTGRDKKMNYPIIKHLRINEQQNANWDFKKVRAFLDNRNQLDILREMFEKGVIKVYKDKLTEEYQKFLEEL